MNTLDPRPWLDTHGRRFAFNPKGSVWDTCPECKTLFNPRDGYSQDQKDYR